MSMLINRHNSVPKNIEALLVNAEYGQKFSIGITALKGITALQGKNELSYLERLAHLSTLNDFGVKFSQLSMEDKNVVLQEIGEKFFNFNALLARK